MCDARPTVGRVNVKISWSTPLYNKYFAKIERRWSIDRLIVVVVVVKVKSLSHSATFFFFRFFLYFILRGIVANAAQNTLTCYIYRIIIIIYYLFSTQVDGFCSSFSHVSSFSHSLSFALVSLFLYLSLAHTHLKKNKKKKQRLCSDRSSRRNR